MKRLIKKISLNYGYYNENDNVDYDDSSEAMQWLKAYVSDTFFSKVVPDDHIVDELRSNFPLDGPTTLYRGINFRTEEQYNAFMESIQSGIMETYMLSSWSKDPGEAEQFAYSTMVDYPDLEVMRLYDERRQNKERISGYRGVVLKTTATPDMALVDVTKTPFSREQEVILLPGEIPVEIYKEIKTFKDEFAETDINEYIHNLTSENFDQQAIDYILHHHGNELDDESRHKIYELFKPNYLVYVEINEEPKEMFNFNPDETHSVAKIYLNTNFLNNIYPFLTEEDKQEVQEQLDTEAEEVAYIVNHEEIDKFEGAPISLLEKYIDKQIVDQIAKPIGKKVRESYEEANRQMREDFRKYHGTDLEKRLKDFLDHLKML